MLNTEDTLQDAELRYIRRDLDELKQTAKDGFKDLAVEMKGLREGYVRREDIKTMFEEFKKSLDLKADKEKLDEVEKKLNSFWYS
jgi:hypothetical protein